jgi:HlyD family secretion protein
MNRKAALAAAGVGLGLLLSGCHRDAGSADTPSGTFSVDSAHLASRHGGRVVRIHVHEGDAVQSGALLLELEAPELLARRDQLRATLAEFEAGPRPEEIAEARASVEALASELTLAESERKRSEDLFARKTISETERDRAVSRAVTLSKQMASAQARLNLLLAGTRRERLDLVRAQLAELDTQIRELRVTAPTAGVIESIPVKPGDVLAPGREGISLILDDSLWMRVYVPQSWLGTLAPGRAVTLRADALPGRTISGTVEQVAREAEFTPRNVQTPSERIQQVFGVKIRIPNPQHDLRAGLTAELVSPAASSPAPKTP